MQTSFLCGEKGLLKGQERRRFKRHPWFVEPEYSA